MSFTEKNQENVTYSTDTHLSQISEEIKLHRTELRKDVQNFYIDFDLANVLQVLKNAKAPLKLQLLACASMRRRAQIINDMIVFDELANFLVALQQNLDTLDRLSLEREAVKIAAAVAAEQAVS